MQPEIIRREDLEVTIRKQETLQRLIDARHEYCFNAAVGDAQQDAIDGGYWYDHDAFMRNYTNGVLDIYDFHGQWVQSLIDEDDGDYPAYEECWGYEPEIQYDDAVYLLSFLPDDAKALVHAEAIQEYCEENGLEFSEKMRRLCWGDDHYFAIPRKRR